MASDFRGGVNKAAPYQKAVVRAELELELERAMSGPINPENLDRVRTRLAEAEENLQRCLDGRAHGTKVVR